MWETIKTVWNADYGKQYDNMMFLWPCEKNAYLLPLSEVSPFTYFNSCEKNRFSMQTTGTLYQLPCISLGVERGCYIVVIKLSPEEGNLIIYNLVITLQSHAVHEINNVRVGVKKQMAPPPGLQPLTFEPLPFFILWLVSYITAQINDFGACRQQMSPSWHSVISIYVFNQRNISYFWCDEVYKSSEVRKKQFLHDEKHLTVKAASLCVLRFDQEQQHILVNIMISQFSIDCATQPIAYLATCSSWAWDLSLSFLSQMFSPLNFICPVTVNQLSM